MSAIAVDPLIKEARDRQRRRRIVLLVAVLALGGGAYGASRALSNGTTQSDAAEPPLYGLERASSIRSTLARVDPQTFQLVGRRLQLGRDLYPSEVSPDGKRLVLLNLPQPTRRNRAEPTLAIVDLATLRLRTGLQARIAAAFGDERAVTAVWPTERRILVVAQRFGARRWRRGPRRIVGQSLVALDTATGRLDWRRPLGTRFFPSYGGGGAVAGSGIVVLQSRRGVARVLSVSPRGVVHSSTVRLLAGGYGSYPARLVVAGGRAYLLTGGGVVYSVDAATARATPHRLPTPAAAPDTSPPALILGAAPLGHNIVVSSFFPRHSGFAAAGIYVIDPRNWHVRLADPTTPTWLVADGSLVTFTASGRFRLSSSWSTKGTGVRIYDTAGRLRAHLYGTQAFESVFATPRLALAFLPGSPRALVFDPKTGHALGTRVIRERPPALIEPGPLATRHS